MGVLIAYSSSAHRNLDLLPTREVPDRTGYPCRTTSYGVAVASPATALRRLTVSSAPADLRARGNARRRTAWSRQTTAGCRYAPRPGSVPRGSGTHSSSIATMRSRSLLAARSRHPTQVRSGHARACVRPDTPKSTSPHRPLSRRVSGEKSNGCLVVLIRHLGGGGCEPVYRPGRTGRYRFIPRPARGPGRRPGTPRCRDGCRCASP